MALNSLGQVPSGDFWHVIWTVRSLLLFCI